MVRMGAGGGGVCFSPPMSENLLRGSLSETVTRSNTSGDISEEGGASIPPGSGPGKSESDTTWER